MIPSVIQYKPAVALGLSSWTWKPCITKASIPLFLVWISPFPTFFNLVLPLLYTFVSRRWIWHTKPAIQRAWVSWQGDQRSAEPRTQCKTQTPDQSWNHHSLVPNLPSPLLPRAVAQEQQHGDSGILLSTLQPACLPACTSLSNTPEHSKNTHTICLNSRGYAKLWLVKASGRQVVMWLTGGGKKLFCPLSNTDLPLMLQNISSCNSAPSLFSSPPCHHPYICSYKSTLSWFALKVFPPWKISV